MLEATDSGCILLIKIGFLECGKRMVVGGETGVAVGNHVTTIGNL